MSISQSILHEIQKAFDMKTKPSKGGSKKKSTDSNKKSTTESKKKSNDSQIYKRNIALDTV